MRPTQTRRRLMVAVGAILAVIIVVVAVVLIWQPFASSPDGDQAVEPNSTSMPSDPSADPSAGLSSDPSSGPQAVPDPPVEIPTPQIEPMTASPDAPTAKGIKKQLAKPLKNPKLAQFAGIVIDPVTGDVLWKHDATDPRLPASSMKVLTGAVLLASTDPNSRMVTTVVQGDEPGEIVLVGGGDVTLSARPEGAPTMLPGGPTVADLAAQLESSEIDVTSIVLDTSYWEGDDLAKGWQTSDIRGTPEDAHGYITKMSALMVDADRVNPGEEDSIRTGEPAETAGKALARELGDEDLPISMGEAPDDGEVLAKVESQPLSTLVAQALENSDNVLTEALARQIAIALGAPPSFDGVSAAITQALGDMEIDTTGVVIEDGSGMSNADRVPVQVLGHVMAMAVAGDDHVSRTLLNGLPLGGVSGTLAPPRFSQPKNEAGAGWVRAKTGSLNSTYALVGYVPDEDGRLLVFAVNSNGVDSDNEAGTRPALDTFAAALRGCGCTGK